MLAQFLLLADKDTELFPKESGSRTEIDGYFIRSPFLYHPFKGFKLPVYSV